MDLSPPVFVGYLSDMHGLESGLPDMEPHSDFTFEHLNGAQGTPNQGNGALGNWFDTDL